MPSESQQASGTRANRFLERLSSNIIQSPIEGLQIKFTETQIFQSAGGRDPGNVLLANTCRLEVPPRVGPLTRSSEKKEVILFC